MNDNTVLFSSLLLDACIVPVSVPVCHLDSRQQQQQPSLMNNQQHQLQHQQNNPPHLAYQQANHHSYTTVTTSNQHGPTPMGAHQQGPVPLHLQQQVSSLLYPKLFTGAFRRATNPCAAISSLRYFDYITFFVFTLFTFSLSLSLCLFVPSFLEPSTSSFVSHFSQFSLFPFFPFLSPPYQPSLYHSPCEKSSRCAVFEEKIE